MSTSIDELTKQMNRVIAEHQTIAKLVWEDRGKTPDDTLPDRIREILALWDNANAERQKARAHAAEMEGEYGRLQGLLRHRERQGSELVELLKPYIPEKMNEPAVFAGVRGALAHIAELEAKLAAYTDSSTQAPISPTSLALDPAAQWSDPAVGWAVIAAALWDTLAEIANVDVDNDVRSVEWYRQVIRKLAARRLDLIAPENVHRGGSLPTRATADAEEAVWLRDIYDRAHLKPAMLSNTTGQKWAIVPLEQVEQVGDWPRSHVVQHKDGTAELKTTEPRTYHVNTAEKMDLQERDPDKVVAAISTHITDKLATSDISKTRLVQLLREAQAECDKLVGEKLKLESELERIEIARACESDRAKVARARQTTVPPFCSMERAAALWDLLVQIENTGPWGAEHVEHFHAEVMKLCAERHRYFGLRGDQFAPVGSFGVGPVGRWTREEQKIEAAVSKVFDTRPVVGTVIPCTIGLVTLEEMTEMTGWLVRKIISRAASDRIRLRVLAIEPKQIRLWTDEPLSQEQVDAFTSYCSVYDREVRRQSNINYLEQYGNADRLRIGSLSHEETEGAVDDLQCALGLGEHKDAPEKAREAAKARLVPRGIVLDHKAD